MLDLSQLACFLTIVEEGSFTKAAQALGVAQPAVSQKLQRLEDQLGIKLLNRTSRAMVLTREGQAFVAFAERVLEAEEAARVAAQQLAKDQRNRIRLGTIHSLVDVRRRVIGRYLALAPETQIEMTFGSRPVLFQMLRDRQIDICLCLAGPGGPSPDIEAIPVGRKVAYLAVPRGHPLDAHEAVTVDDFRGLQLVISPGNEDAPVLENLAQGLLLLGAQLIRAPEAERRLIDTFARSRGLPSLRWASSGLGRHNLDGLVVVPITGDPFVGDYYVYISKGPRTEPVQRFCAFLRDITKEWVSILDTVPD